MYNVHTHTHTHTVTLTHQRTLTHTHKHKKHTHAHTHTHTHTYTHTQAHTHTFILLAPADQVHSRHFFAVLLPLHTVIHFRCGIKSNLSLFNTSATAERFLGLF